MSEKIKKIKDVLEEIETMHERAYENTWDIDDKNSYLRGFYEGEAHALTECIALLKKAESDE